jgi:hypothetical protein
MRSVSDGTRNRLVKQLKKTWEIGFDREPTREFVLLVPPDSQISDLDFSVFDAEAAALANAVVAAWKEVAPEHGGIEVRFQSSTLPARLGTSGLLRDNLEPLNFDFYSGTSRLDIDQSLPLFKLIVEQLPAEIQDAQERRLAQRLQLIKSEVMRRGAMLADYEERIAAREQGEQGELLSDLRREAEMEHYHIEELRAICRGRRGGVGEPYKGPVIPE